MASWSSAIDYTFENDDGNECVVTVGYTFTPRSKPRRYGHPDDWHDGEGPEIDINGATWKATEKELTTEELELLLGDYQDSICEKIKEAENEKDE